MRRKLKEEMPFLRGNFLVLVLSYVFFNFGHTISAPFESPFLEELGATPFAIGVVGFVSLVILFFVRIPGSYIADKHGRRQIIVFMSYGAALSYFFFVFASNWILYAVGAVLMSFCFIYQPALDAVEADSLPPGKRGVGYAAIRVLPLLPAVFSPLVAGFLVNLFSIDFGMRIVYSIALTSGLAASIVRHLFLKETLKESKPVKLKEFKTAFKDALSEIFDAWRFMPKSLVFLLFSSLIIAFTDPFFYSFGSLYALKIAGLTDFEWSKVNTAKFAVILAAGLFLGKAVDIFGGKKALITAHLIFAAFTMLFILSTNFSMLLMVYIFLALASVLYGSATSALQADIIPKEKRGRVLGSMGALYILASALGSLAGGFLYESVSPQAPFLLVVPLDTISLLIILLKVKEPEKKEV